VVAFTHTLSCALLRCAGKTLFVFLLAQHGKAQRGVCANATIQILSLAHQRVAHQRAAQQQIAQLSLETAMRNSA